MNGKELEDLRKKHGLSRAQIAQISGAGSARTVDRWVQSGKISAASEKLLEQYFASHAPMQIPLNADIRRKVEQLAKRKGYQDANIYVKEYLEKLFEHTL